VNLCGEYARRIDVTDPYTETCLRKLAMKFVDPRKLFAVEELQQGALPRYGAKPKCKECDGAGKILLLVTLVDCKACGGTGLES